MDRRTFSKLAGTIGAFAVAAGIGIPIGVSVEYADLPTFDNGFQAGRTKNSISAIVSGLVGQKLYGYSDIDLVIEKYFWPDAKVVGHTTPKSIDTYVDLFLTSSHFIAEKNSNGTLEGIVDKSEFDWKVREVSKDTYTIERFGIKYNADLSLIVENGNIRGKYIRHGISFDWDIKGTYDNSGNVDIDIDGPWNLGITLKGKIAGKSQR